MRCSPFCLRAFLACVCLAGFGAAPSWAAGSSDPAWLPLPKAPADAALRPLGGPVVAGSNSGPNSGVKTPPRTPNRTSFSSNAATLAPPSSDDSSVTAWPSYEGASQTDSSEKSTVAGQPSAVSGPTPYDLASINRIQVGAQSIAQTPLRVGNLDILAPFVDEMATLGATVSSAAPGNVPGFGNGPNEAQYFQINVPKGPPIVLTIGKASAWINDAQGFHETQLRAAPLIIGKQIYLPVFSLAPLLGAATRLRDDGTLVLTPTVQSVELFTVKDAVAVTIKTSAPVPSGAATIVTVPGKPGTSPKVYIDFSGFSMGFDAGNSTIERLVAPGAGDVLRARAGMPSKFPDTTRICLDLKRPLVGTRVMLDGVKTSQSAPAGTPTEAPDPTLFALIISPSGSPSGKRAAQLPDEFFKNPQPPAASPRSDNPLILLPGTNQSLRGMTIVVDPGHGGKDTGAPGHHSLEKTHVLDISRRLRSALQKRGANVLLTRDSDNFISLQGRVDFANQRRADLFISVHINAAAGPDSTGTETFYYNATSQALAIEVHKQLLKATGRPNRKIHQRRLFVVRHTWMPSILTETAFITNPKEEAMLLDPNFRERVARGIAQGVANYVSIYGRAGISG